LARRSKVQSLFCTTSQVKKCTWKAPMPSTLSSRKSKVKTEMIF
jgi:hypothetical protein